MAVEVECSLLSIEPELLEVIKACEELDIALVGYCAPSCMSLRLVEGG